MRQCKTRSARTHFYVLRKHLQIYFSCILHPPPALLQRLVTYLAITIPGGKNKLNDGKEDKEEKKKPASTKVKPVPVPIPVQV